MGATNRSRLSRSFNSTLFALLILSLFTSNSQSPGGSPRHIECEGVILESYPEKRSSKVSLGSRDHVHMGLTIYGSQNMQVIEVQKTFCIAKWLGSATDEKPKKGDLVITIIMRGLLPKQSAGFALKLIKNTISGYPGNRAFAPVNIKYGLTLLYAGSTGATAKNLAKVLGLSTNPRDSLIELGKEKRKMEKIGPGNNGNLMMTIGLWGDSGFPARESYLQLLERSTIAPFITLPFLRSPNTAYKAVDAWVKKNSGGMFTQVPHPPKPPAFLMTSCFYLKCNWSRPFEKSKTGGCQGRCRMKVSSYAASSESCG